MRYLVALLVLFYTLPMLGQRQVTAFTKKTLLTLCFTLLLLPLHAQFTLTGGSPTTLACDDTEQPVVQTALQLFRRDYAAVFTDSLRMAASITDTQATDEATPATDASIIVGTLGTAPLLNPFEAETAALKERQQAFLLKVLPDGRLLIAGSDAHGTAYGLMELSRLIGVSPWEWWADVAPMHRDTFTLPADYSDLQAPSVEYRGIFINDEDFALVPWTRYNHEPVNEYGTCAIGPRTHERIFELLLRLKANTFWPAMHECTTPFFLTKGNREVAARFGIHIGTSHCEPLACNANGEWSIRGEGAYDYAHNAPAVYRFWEARVKETADNPMIYTIGMRGVHDGQMQGVSTMEEHQTVMARVLHDQRELLRQYVNPDVTAVPQVFIPYKEVLDLYNAGLDVPDDVTLMWCDDNYGYIQHFPTDEERARAGGNGIYYHVSYWGRPHDYLWLGTFSPYLLYQQMKAGYDNGIRKMWILNVGDIKPAEYQIQLFMDMAWNMDEIAEEGVTAHLDRFLQTAFGSSAAEQLLPLMQEHYRLAYIHKPEFMGNTQTEVSGTSHWRTISDLPWSADYIHQRLEAYDALSGQAESIEASIPSPLQDAYLQLVKYPVQAAGQMNRKLLYAQLARHGLADWSLSDAAFDSISVLTRQYNAGIHNHGKWQRMMDFQPRRLPVFEPVSHTTLSTPMPEERPALYRWNATECTTGTFIPCEGLGYEGKAASIAKESEVTFAFDHPACDSISVEIQLLPTRPISGDRLRFAITVDDSPAQTIAYETVGRSEEWKINVLWNRALRQATFPVKKKKLHRLTIKAIDNGVVLDQVRVYAKQP